jgi:hypothetical protein
MSERQFLLVCRGGINWVLFSVSKLEELLMFSILVVAVMTACGFGTPLAQWRPFHETD